MPKKKKPTKRQPAKPAPAQEYRIPHSAAELGLVCSQCGAPAVWFDFGRARSDHRAGFVCDDHPAIGQREKLLVKSGQGISERCEPGSLNGE